MKNVQKAHGAKLFALECDNVSINAAGRATGYYAQVDQTTSVDPDLVPEEFGKVYAVYKLNVPSDFHLEDGVETISATVFESNTTEDGVAENEFGVYLTNIAGSPGWIDDTNAVPTLGLSGKVTISSRSVLDEERGAQREEYYVVFIGSSPTLQYEAETHLAKFAGRTYAEMLSSDDMENGCSARQMFETDSDGETLAEAVLKRMADAGAEAVANAFGFEFAKIQTDTIQMRPRPVPELQVVTNVIRSSQAAGRDVVDIFSETAHVDGQYLYNFGGVASMAIVKNTKSRVVSLCPRHETGSSFMIEGKLSDDALANVTWDGIESGIGSPVLAEMQTSWKSSLEQAKAEWKTGFYFLASHAAKTVANNELDRPLSKEDVLVL